MSDKFTLLCNEIQENANETADHIGEYRDKYCKLLSNTKQEINDEEKDYSCELLLSYDIDEKGQVSCSSMYYDSESSNNAIICKYKSDILIYLSNLDYKIHLLSMKDKRLRFSFWKIRKIIFEFRDKFLSDMKIEDVDYEGITLRLISRLKSLKEKFNRKKNEGKLTSFNPDIIEENICKLEKFITNKKKLPDLYSTNAKEISLARFCYKLTKIREELSEKNKRRIDKILKKKKTIDEKIDDFYEYIRQVKKIPSRKSKDPIECKFANFLYYQKNYLEKRKKEFDEETELKNRAMIKSASLYKK